MIDTHMHTAKFSADSSLDIERLVREKKDEDVYCITEHLEFEDLMNERRLSGEIPNDYFLFNREAYFEQYTPLRDKKIYLGVEMGLNHEKKELFDEFYSKRFDYILGSLHCLDGVDFYEDRTIYNEDKISLYSRYLKRATEYVHLFKYVNALAHFDYITRYPLEGQYEDNLYRVSELKDQFIELFKAMKEENVLLEINTKSPIDYEEMTKILTLYKECGNDYVVIGSDAHKNEAVFNHFESVLEMIKKVGLKQAYFVKQQMVTND